MQFAIFSTVTALAVGLPAAGFIRATLAAVVRSFPL